MEKKKYMTEAEKREAKLTAKLELLAAAGDWDGVIAELDWFDENNQRRHETHRDDLDITLLDRQARDGDHFCAHRLLKLSRAADWDEIIFSQDPEDLHHLVEEYPVSAALRELSPVQKKILLENIVYGISTKSLAEEIGCSTRNITKHRKKALDTVRLLVTGER